MDCVHCVKIDVEDSEIQLLLLQDKPLTIEVTS